MGGSGGSFGAELVPFSPVPHPKPRPATRDHEPCRPGMIQLLEGQSNDSSYAANVALKQTKLDAFWACDQAFRVEVKGLEPSASTLRT